VRENVDLGRATKAVLEGSGDPDAPVKRGRGRPRTRPLDEERRLILSAAMQVLTDVGYGGATIEAIARTAGVQRRSIYEQFTDRDTLLVAAMDVVLDEVFAQFAEVLGEAAGLSVAEYLRFTMKRGIEIMANEPGFRAVVAAAYVGGDEPTAVRARAARSLMEEAVMASIIEHFASVGIDDPALARLHASTSVALLATLSLRAGDEPDWDIDRVADYVADLVFGGQAYLDGSMPPTPPFTRPRRR
jgi:AcrR family transcriptional regulator